MSAVLRGEAARVGIACDEPGCEQRFWTRDRQAIPALNSRGVVGAMSVARSRARWQAWVTGVGEGDNRRDFCWAHREPEAVAS